MRKLLILLILAIMTSTIIAQDTSFDIPDESGRAFALSVTENGIQLGEIQQNFGGTIDVDYNPADPRRWARVDNFGILRFVDLGNPEITEGVYTFSPFFEGFEAPSPEENKYFVRDVAWSPDGRMLAFYSENTAISDLDQGLWFWQPVQELATDPAYQLMRPCPNYCETAGVASDYAGWDILDFEWSNDNSTILVTTNAFEYSRRALTVRFAQRVDPPPATVAPTFLLFDYGHWDNSGQQIIVSGNSPDNTVVFGTVDRAGGNPIVTLASEIGMAWVQDAVQQSDGSLLMLGSSLNASAPLQIINQEGLALTPPIGNSAPDSVVWSPNKTAVLLRIGTQTFVASINGTVYDITAEIEGSPNIDWVNGALPANFISVSLPTPIAEGEFLPEETPEIIDGREFTTGDLLRVSEGVLDIYAEPIDTANIVGSLVLGDELIITDTPLISGDISWYRVQTLDFTGWINTTSTLEFPDN